MSLPIASPHHPALHPAARDGEELTDEQVVARVLAGERELFELLMRRHNQRLYRLARGILGDDSEAEDVTQDAYVRAYSHLGQFGGRSRFATWLLRIALHEALARARRRGRLVEIDAMPEFRRDSLLHPKGPEHDPEQRAIGRNLQALLEDAIDTLPGPYRVVFLMRHVEGLSTSATAECLGLEPGAVKTRLLRARSSIRRRLGGQAGLAAGDLFTFDASRCDRVVAAVLARLA